LQRRREILAIAGVFDRNRLAIGKSWTAQDEIHVGFLKNVFVWQA
jgi:hypothetical protein